jgi:hypothetical protein
MVSASAILRSLLSVLVAALYPRRCSLSSSLLSVLAAVGPKALMLPLLLFATLALAGKPPQNGWLEEDLAPVSIELGQRDARRCSKHWLFNGRQLPPSPTLYKRWHREKAYGTPEMINLIQTGAEEMAWLVPDADPIVVGDISTRSGGHLEGHKSHMGGLDADIGLYWGEGKMYMAGFREVSPQNLDAHSNWLLIRAMLATGDVERILLDQKLINAVRRHAIDSGDLTVSEANRIFWRSSDPRVWSQDGVVHHIEGHKHHMHVRVKCPE